MSSIFLALIPPCYGALVEGTNAGFVTVAPSADPGGASTTTADYIVRIGKFTSPAGATTITEIGWWCDNATEAANFEVGVYSDIVGTADWLLWASRTNAKGTDAGWKKATGLSIPINENTDYWLAFQLDNTATTTTVDYTTNASYTRDRLTSKITAPFNWGTGLQAEGILAIYAVYNTIGTPAATITPVVPTTHKTWDVTISDKIIRLPQQKSTFYAAGRYWAFYGDDTVGDDRNIDYITSTDLVTWTSPATIATYPLSDACWDVRFDGTYVHYIRSTSLAPQILEGLAYRRGTPVSDGTISWSAAEQTIYAVEAGASDPSLNIDSNGYPYVGSDNSGNGQINKSSTNDGTWSTAGGYPLTLDATNEQPIVLPLLNGEMYVVMTEYNADTKANGYHWDGASWNTELEITEETVGPSGSPYVPRINAVSVDGKVYMVYHSTGGELRFNIRLVVGGWGTEETFEDFYLDLASSPLLASNGDDCYVLWQLDESGFYYTRRLEDGTWERTQRMIEILDLGGIPHSQISGVENNGISFQYFDDVDDEIIFGFAEAPGSPPRPQLISITEN